MYATGDRKIGCDAAIENRHPSEWQAQLFRGAKYEARHDVEGFEIKVGLIEAIEQHERVDAGPRQPLGHVRRRAEVGTQFYCYGNRDDVFHIVKYVQVDLLDLSASFVDARGN